jgi:phosphatidylserine/phosphatidylglycerophosphate/cardiolipin synthase-like enzyme
MPALMAMILIQGQLFAKKPYALFSPHQGEEAFNTIYKWIEEADETAYVSIYSWSDRDLEGYFKTALDNKVEVKIVLHNALWKKATDELKENLKKGIDKIPTLMRRVQNLERAGAIIKVSHQGMHEKMVIIDGDQLMNSSANMSGGAKKRYSEDFIFVEVDDESEKDNIAMIEQFEKEFAHLYNTAKDIITEGEIENSKMMKQDVKNNIPRKKGDAILYSSSHAQSLKVMGEDTATYKKGIFVKTKNDKNKKYVVSKALIKAIDNARKTIHFNLNHLFLDNVSEAATRAMKRGVKIKWALDNQEFKYETGESKSPIAKWIKEFKKFNKAKIIKFKKESKKKYVTGEELLPIRIKYYSHSPSPKHWFLNHHKYTIIDYDKDDYSNTVLFAGSHNLSHTAESNQYDSLVKFQGDYFIPLYDAYYEQFENLWNLGRIKSGKRKDKIQDDKIDHFFKLVDGDKIPLHTKQPHQLVSLTWSETKRLRKAVKDKANGYYPGSFKMRDCTHMSVETGKYFTASWDKQKRKYKDFKKCRGAF